MGQGQRCHVRRDAAFDPFCLIVSGVRSLLHRLGRPGALSAHTTACARVQCHRFPNHSVVPSARCMMEGSAQPCLLACCISCVS